MIAPEDLAILKVISDRPRDFDDLVVFLRRASFKLDMGDIEDVGEDARREHGRDEVTE